MPRVGWTELQTFWECPRAASYQFFGWRSPTAPHNMLRGLFAHAGVAAYWQGQNVQEAVGAAMLAHLEGVSGQGWADAAGKAAREALEMVGRYAGQSHKDLVVEVVETPLVVPLGEGQDVHGTPDIVGTFKGQAIIVDLKTTDAPNIEALTHSGQLDYYAALWAMQGHPAVELVGWHILTPEMQTSLWRTPRPEVGKYIREWAETLARTSRATILDMWPLMPQYTRRCFSCPYLSPCKTLDEGGDDQVVLNADFILGEGAL